MSQLNLPEPFASIPKEDFLFGPSPIQHLPNMTAKLGGKVGVYAKREDCNSGLAYGGNKVRKLEYVHPPTPSLWGDMSLGSLTIDIDTLPPKPSRRAPILSSPLEVSSPTTPAQSPL